MKILFYIEPFFEFNNPLFRIPTIKSVVIPFAETLGNYAEVSILTSEETLKNLDTKSLNIKTISIDHTIFLRYFSSYVEYSELMQKNEAPQEKIIELAQKIKQAVNKYQPDIVINYESSSQNLIKLLFDKSKVVNMMFGPFSRIPFPSTTFLDKTGIYKNSSINGIIKARKLTQEELNCLRKIRRKTVISISENCFYKDLIYGLRKKYQKIILIACQIDNYFAFKACSDFSSSIEIIENTLKLIPSNYGVIVTSHGEFEQQYTENQIFEIQKKYPNCEFINTNIPYISQWIIPYVDCLVTVSSSLGFQAILWGKVLILAGKSHLNPLAHGYLKEGNIIELLSNDKCFNSKDSVLYEILSKFTFFDKYEIKDKNTLIKILNNIANDNNLILNQSPQTVSNKFLNSFRGLPLRNLFEEHKIPKNIDHLMSAIAKHDYISFDVFDTLICRPFIEPWHLFVGIQEKIQVLLQDYNFNFVHYRRLAEANVRRYSGDSTEVSIEEIYEELQQLTGLQSSYITEIMNLEIDAEITVCTDKRGVKPYYQLARLLNLPIIIISDTYLHEETIKKILTKSGYFGWTRIYSSCDTKIRKHDGKLFKKVLKDFNILKPESLLHIGDNVIADFQRPREYGIHSYQIPSSKDQYSKSLINNYLPCDINKIGIYGSIVSGMIINRSFSETFHRINNISAFDSSPKEFGYSCVGPLILGFVQWVHRRATRNNDNFLYFLARDGWLPQKAYNLLYKEKAIPNKYMYVSRRALSVPSIKNINDIIEIAFQSFEARPLGELLSSRFGLIEKDIPKEVLNKHNLTLRSIVTPTKCMNKLRHFLEDISSIIITHANNEKVYLMEYLKQIGFDTNIKKHRVGFVDIGYSGSMQRFMSKIFDSNNIDGLYFLTHFFSRNRHGNEQIDGYLSTEDDHRSSLRHKLNDYVFLFESILSSPEGSIINFKKDKILEPNFIYEDNENERVKTLNQIHNGALAFLYDMEKFLYPNYLNTFEIPASIASSIMLNFCKNPSEADSKIFKNLGVENQYGGGSVCLIENSEVMKNDDIHIKAIIQRSKWKEGAIALYRKKSSTKIIEKSPNSPIQSREEKLLNKLEQSPKKFFSDSKNIFSKIIGLCFYNRITETNLGELFKKIAVNHYKRLIHTRELH